MRFIDIGYEIIPPWPKEPILWPRKYGYKLMIGSIVFIIHHIAEKMVVRLIKYWNRILKM